METHVKRSRAVWFAVAVMAVPASLVAQNPTPPPAAPVVTPTGQTAAQAAAQAATGRSVSNDQIVQALRSSGMSPQQVRQRLRAAGYDTTLADPYFGGGSTATQGASTAAGLGSSEFANALQAMGLLTTAGAENTAADSVRRVATATPPRQQARVFGKDIFNRTATVFDPVTAGPVDPAYRLGIGDQVQLVVTGQVELAYALELRRDGSVIVPQVGQIDLAGLTLDGARTLLRQRMARSYSGLNSGEARLDLSISRIRSNAVFVIGEVENPGAYQVNGLATVFHAIARAGGPTDRGSFRNVEIRRGNKVIQRLDLYDYLLKGDAAGDIRLEQGDVIFVPLNTRAVSVIGQVRRPRIFELREGEGFSDLFRFAGGFTPDAASDRVQIDRILPAAQRAPGFDRVKVDVDMKGSVDALARVPLIDGDVVEVFAIGAVRRNVVDISGQVWAPGQYEFKRGKTLGTLLDEAQGLMPWAIADRVKVVRQQALTGRTTVQDVNASTAAGRGFVLEEFDAVEVLDGRLAYAAGTITVEGAVNLPGTRQYSEGESLRDAIERSGGVKEEAQAIELYRHRTGANYSDTTSLRYTYPVGANFARETSLRDVKLQRDDRIVVLSSPGFRTQQFVTVNGQFKYPGTYAITENVDRVSDVVRRAGDPLPGAYDGSFHLIRNGLNVSVDFARAMRGDKDHNVPVLGGDQLVIDRDPNTVLVTGAVSRASLVKFQKGRSVQDYIDLAGGPTERGEEAKAVVQYPSGISQPVKKVAFFFHTSPEVISGSTITVPEKPQQQTNTDMWQRVLATSTALASLILAYSAITK